MSMKFYHVKIHIIIFDVVISVTREFYGAMNVAHMVFEKLLTLRFLDKTVANN